MSSMSFSQLAQICADAEITHASTKLEGIPTVVVGVAGDHVGKSLVHILSGPPNTAGTSLTGIPLKYIRDSNKTIVVLKCAEIRQFYKNLGWTFEDFLYSDRRYLH